MKMKNAILIFSVILITSSCSEDGKKTNEKSAEEAITDTLKNMEVKQISTTSETVVNAAENPVSDAFQNTSPAPIIGSWDDVDPADPGPGSQSLTIETNGECNISEQEGGYKGKWSYDPANGILNLKLSHINGAGETDSEVDNDYKIEEITENRIKIIDLTDQYPKLGGFFWKSNTP
jgi:hypothetical protein